MFETVYWFGYFGGMDDYPFCCRYAAMHNRIGDFCLVMILQSEMQKCGVLFLCCPCHPINAEGRSHKSWKNTFNSFRFEFNASLPEFSFLPQSLK